MNHDETTSGDDAHLDRELEARIVAAVLGEASAFEQAELNRRVNETPALAIFKRRIEAVHGLVGAATRPEQAPLRLSPERRARLLQSIGVQPTESAPPAQLDAIIVKFSQARRNRRTRWIWTSGLAASLTLAAIVGLNFPHSNEQAAFARPEAEIAMMQMPMVQMPSNDAEDSSETAEHREFSPPAQSDLDFGSQEKRRERPIHGFAQGLIGRPSSLLPAPPPPFGGEDKRMASAFTREADALSSGARYYVAPHPSTFAKSSSQPRLLASAPAPAANLGRPFIAEFNAPSQSPNESTTFDFYNKLEVSDEPPIVLSPFEVSASQELGYAASSTLAGTRINTTLRDIGSGIRVAKKPFLAQLEPATDDGFLSGHSDKAAANAHVWKAPLAPGTSAAAIDDRLSKGSKIAAASVLPKADIAVVSLQEEITTAQQAVSTFSLHVSDVSFRLAQAALARGEIPDPARIRPEEFYNAFDYGDPVPSTSDKLGCRIEQAAHPFLQQRNLVRIAMKVPSAGRGASQPLHLTVLLDTSGSMEREDRIGSVRRALEVLASLLSAQDRVTLIGFAREPRLLTEAMPGDQAGKLAELAAQTPFTGGTNLEEALRLSGELARRHQRTDAQNRIVLITDGAANLGNADPAQLATMIETFRQQGISFDACGVGTDGLDDAVLEALTRKGNGRYYVLDQPSDADKGFAQQLAGAFRPAAENVKVQVRFNPARVGHYRLIGFEQHRLREEDFRNDQVDAAELAADEAAIALYQVEVLPEGTGELGEVFVRFRDPASASMVERSWTILHDTHASAFDRATPTLQLAGTAALVAEKLRGGAVADLIALDRLVPVVNSLRGRFAQQPRVQEFTTMFEQLRRQTAK